MLPYIVCHFDFFALALLPFFFLPPTAAAVCRLRLPGSPAPAEPDASDLAAAAAGAAP